MSTLAVVRTTPVIPKRDLLLFDEFYVLNLDSQLDRLAGADLADALYLIDRGVIKPAEVPIEQLAEPLIVGPSLRHPMARWQFDLVKVGGYIFRLDARNLGADSIELHLDASKLLLPKGAARFIAASISEKMAPLGHCTFLLDRQSPQTLRETFNGQIVVATRSYGDSLHQLGQGEDDLGVFYRG